MKIYKMISALILVAFAGTATADVEMWKDYTLSESVSNVTTVKVDSNRIDTYLEGLRTTWASTNAISVELGHIVSYNIYVSELPNSGEFNVVLVTTSKDAAALQPSKDRYDAFMKKWGEESQKESDEVAMTYPDIRTITGEYLLREVTFK